MRDVLKYLLFLCVCSFCLARTAPSAVWLTLNPAAKTVPRFLAALPVLRGAALFIFTAWMWAAVVYACQQAHVNYVFVLDADPRTALNYQQVGGVGGVGAFPDGDCEWKLPELLLALCA